MARQQCGASRGGEHLVEMGETYGAEFLDDSRRRARLGLLEAERGCLFFFQAEDGIRDDLVTGVQTCALPIFFVEPPGVRFSMLGLLAAVFVAVPERSRTLRHAFLLVALPWLAFFAGRSLHDLGQDRKSVV